MRPGRPKKSRKRAGKNRNITYKFLTRMKGEDADRISDHHWNADCSGGTFGLY